MEQLVSYETAKLAKELGFDIPVQDRYKLINWQFPEIGVILNDGERRFGGVSNWNHECFQDKYRQYTSAPTQSLLQKWLRETQDCIILIKSTTLRDVLFWTNNFQLRQVNAELFTTYEEALEDGLLNIMKLKKKSEI